MAYVHMKYLGILLNKNTVYITSLANERKLYTVHNMNESFVLDSRKIDNISAKTDIRLRTVE